MARIKAAKIVPCQTRAEFEDTVDAIAKMAINKEKMVAALKQRHQQLELCFDANALCVTVKAEEDKRKAELCFDANAPV